MKFKTHRIVALMLVTVFALVACAPAPVTPTVDQGQIENQVATAVAATVAAQQTGTAEAQAQFTPTLVATPSETPVLPTATPFVIPTATSFSSGGGGGGGSSQPTYACDIIRQRPYDNSEFRPGDSFDIKWTLLNTGTATWRAGTDFKYFSGPRMTSAGLIELPEMKPGDQYSVRFDANAPADKGFQVMTWVVQGGFCYPYVAINVK